MSLALLLALRLGAPVPAGQEPPRSTPGTGRAEAEALAPVLAGTERALATLRECERQLAAAPREALPLLLRVTEAPSGGPAEQAERLTTLRNEVIALLAELDDLRATLALAPTRELPAYAERAARTQLAPLDDLGAPFAPERTPAAPAEPPPYSADPLRHGIACYRAGRYDEACQLLAPLDEARAHYWRARALERLERYDEAIQALERAVAQGGEGFERRRAETDLELVRWKRDHAKTEFTQNLPGAPRAVEPGERRPR